MTDTDKVLFPSRFGIESKSVIDSDFPESARIGLWYILCRNVELKRTEGWVRIAEELLRLQRWKRTFTENEAADLSYSVLNEIEWKRVYIFCERVFEKLLSAQINYDYQGDPETVYELDLVRKDYEADINQLLGEETIVYRIKNGEFYRPGRLHSQKIVSKASIILLDPALRDARQHFNKARQFFEKAPEPDFPNAIKEAVSAMEAATKHLFSTGQQDFERVIKSIKDASGESIPPTIINGLLAPYRFRGAGHAVAHGGATGGSATAAVAEWTLTVVAASIIYLRDIAQSHEAEQPPF